MLRFAGMRCTPKRNLAIAEAKGIGRSAFHKRERLNRLHGRARKNRPLDITDGKHQLAGCVTDGNGAAMPAFDSAAARNLYQDRIAHSRPTNSLAPARSTRTCEQNPPIRHHRLTPECGRSPALLRPDGRASG